MHNYSFSQDYYDNHHSDWNDHNFDCSDHYLNAERDNQVLIQVDEIDTNSKNQLKRSKQQNKKLKFNFSKRKKIDLQNYNQKHHSIIKKNNQKHNKEVPNSLFCQEMCQSNEILSQNTDISSKMSKLSSIKWKFDFIATLIKQTKLEMIQLQKYRNDNQQL